VNLFVSISQDGLDGIFDIPEAKKIKLRNAHELVSTTKSG
jgi:hypothetical protein